MRALVLSDIHANLEALEAVLAHARNTFDELWNLGDMVGYGASPNQVLDLIRPLSTVVVRGNHDRVSCGLTSANAFNPVARTAVFWTRQELTPANTEWLRAVPQGPVLAGPPSGPNHGQASCAHGSPIHEDHYILNMRDAWMPLQQMLHPTTFFGHTHIQGGFAQRAQDWQELRPQYPAAAPGQTHQTAQSHTIPLPPGTRHLINPGSVGQPRDRDWRAAYALYDTAACTVTFHRVPYDLLTSQQKIREANLPDRLAARLKEGR